MRNCKKWAFTLIEMLLVIAIILVLAGMIYPMYSKARESGRATQCVSNLRQLQVAAMNYAGGGGFPRSVSFAYPMRDPYTGNIMFYIHEAGWVSWWNYTNGQTSASSFSGTYGWKVSDSGMRTITNGALWGYINDVRIYLCPSFARMNSGAVRSYSLNYAAGYHHGDSDDPGPAMTMLGGGGTMTPLFSEDDNVRTAPYDGEMLTNEVWKGHNGKGNVVFVDGHVEKW